MGNHYVGTAVVTTALALKDGLIDVGWTVTAKAVTAELPIHQPEVGAPE